MRATLYLMSILAFLALTPVAHGVDETADNGDTPAAETGADGSNGGENNDDLLASFQEWLSAEDGGSTFLQNLGLALGVLIGAWIVGAFVASLVGRALRRIEKDSELLCHFLVKTTRRAIVVIGLIVALNVMGVPMGPFLAAIGAAGLVVGLALQGTLSNFASGIMILIYRPYDIGDVVSVGGVTGKVSSMTLVSTTLLSGDNQTITVPNNSVWGGVITNITGNETRRVDMVFGIGYDDDIAHAQGVLEDIVNAHPLVLSDPAPTIRVSELADSSVNFVCRPWCKTGDYWTVLFDVTTEVKKRFDAESISIPYPQQDVHMHQVAVAS